MRDPVQKFFKTFGHNLNPLQLRPGDDDLPFDDWERLYPNLSVELNGVKEGSKIIISTVKNLDPSGTMGMRKGMRLTIRPNPNARTKTIKSQNLQHQKKRKIHTQNKKEEEKREGEE